MAKRYRVTLSVEERVALRRMVSRGKADARKLAHARVLLQADEAEGGPAQVDEAIAAALNVSVRTIERVRQRFVAQGREAALLPKPASTRASWTANRRPTCWRSPARGRPRARHGGRCACWPSGWWRWSTWTRSRTRRCVRRAKNARKPHLRKMGGIPPKDSAAFVDHMEDVLEVYRRPYDPKHPVVCLDETLRQLIGEVRAPLPPAPGRVERYDCVDVRNGTASLFLAFEPLAGWRHVAVTDSRRRPDGARFKALVEEWYGHAERVVLVMDQLNTRSPASLYAAFPPDEAKRISDRLEIHPTPKHGSWLNMAEIEFSALTRDLPQRIGHRPDLERHVAAWMQRRNTAEVPPPGASPPPTRASSDPAPLVGPGIRRIRRHRIALAWRGRQPAPAVSPQLAQEPGPVAA